MEHNERSEKDQQIMKAIVNAIETFKREKGIKSINAAAEALGITRQTYYNWTNPYTRMKPDIASLQLLHEKTGYDYEFLLGEISEKHKEAHDVCEATGLSENAAEELLQYKHTIDIVHSLSKGKSNIHRDFSKYDSNTRKVLSDFSEFEVLLKIISIIIEHNNLVHKIGNYLYTSNDFEVCAIEHREKGEEETALNIFHNITRVNLNGILVDESLLKASILQEIRDCLEEIIKSTV